MSVQKNIRQMPQISIAETIANAIQGQIISGTFIPGERLVEREIGSRFKVSSIPVREALQILETRGLVIKRINRGCSVVDPTVDEMAQMCELRDWLEPKVMEWAALRSTDAGLATLAVHLRRLREASELGSFTRFYAEDLDFHRCLWDLACNPSAARALMTVVGCLFACGLRNAKVDLRQEYLKHERLYKAVAEGRPSDAALFLTDISSGFRSQLHKAAQELK